jgi:hypothetical protein
VSVSCRPRCGITTSFRSIASSHVRSGAKIKPKNGESEARLRLAASRTRTRGRADRRRTWHGKLQWTIPGRCRLPGRVLVGAAGPWITLWTAAEG